MSWFANSAEELRRQFEQFAGKSDEKAAADDVGIGALFEQGQAVLRASADRAAEQMQLSVQRFASDADEGLQSVRGSFAASVGAAWTRPRTLSAAEISARELLSRFDAEVEALSGSYADIEAGMDDSVLAAPATVAAQTLSAWDQRLQGDLDDSGQQLAAPGLRGLLYSQGLKTALQLLTAGGRRRRPLLGRAAAASAKLADPEKAEQLGESSPTAARRRTFPEAAIDTDMLEAHPGQAEAAAGEQLARVMLRASEAPPELMAQLLALLAEAAEAADRCQVGSLAEERTAAEEDVRWVVNLVLSTLAECREADALASFRLYEALDQLMGACSKTASSSSRSDASTVASPSLAAGYSSSSTPGKVAPFAGGGRPTVGSEVWACWPGDGAWYRARVKGFTARDRVQVRWLPTPADGYAEPSEYVRVKGSEHVENLFSELSSTSVMRVDATIRRPPPAPVDQLLPESLWTTALRSVEIYGQNFQQLRRVGKQLEFHRDWGITTSGGDCTAAKPSVESMWRYMPEDGCHVDIRSAACVDAPRTAEKLVAGEVFKVSETQEGAGGVLYLKLADGRGWVFDKKEGVGTLCVRCEESSDSEDAPEHAIAETSERPPLSGAAETLSAMRVEIEERAEALGSIVSECDEEVANFKEQIKSSTKAMSIELEALRSERQDVVAKAEGLRSRREELLAQLRQVEEELGQVEATCSELDAREKNLNSSMSRVSSELAQQLETTQEHGLVAESRQKVLLSTVKASKQVEDLIAERATAVVEAVAGSSKLSSLEQEVRAATMERDRVRCLELQELLGNWHEAVWGPGSGAFVKDAAAAVALRAAHLQAVSLVEDAQREANEIAAEGSSLGFEGLLSLGGSTASDAKNSFAKQMSRSGASYKLMREQLCENLERLGELECVAAGATPTPSSPPTEQPSMPPQGAAGFFERLGFQGETTPVADEAGDLADSAATAVESLAGKREKLDGGI